MSNKLCRKTHNQKSPSSLIATKPLYSTMNFLSLLPTQSRIATSPPQVIPTPSLQEWVITRRIRTMQISQEWQKLKWRRQKRYSKHYIFLLQIPQQIERMIHFYLFNNKTTTLMMICQTKIQTKNSSWQRELRRQEESLLQNQWRWNHSHVGINPLTTIQIKNQREIILQS